MTTKEWVDVINKSNIMIESTEFSENHKDQNNFIDINDDNFNSHLEEKSRKIVEMCQKGNSKYRFIDGQQLIKTTNIEGLTGIKINSSSESDGVQCNSQNIVFPIEGSSGKLAVLKIDSPGRISNYPFIENSSLVFDFSLCPVDDSILATVCEDSKIRVWNINQDVLNISTTPLSIISGLECRTTLLKFHPFSKGVLASGNINGQLNLWDLNESALKITLNSSSFIQAVSWAANGYFISSISADKIIRHFDPRSNNQPSQNITTDFNIGSSRLEVIDDKYYLASGFTNNGQRIVTLHDYRVPEKFVSKLELDLSPSVLQMYYDSSNNLLYCSGKGETCISIFEVRKTEQSFYFCNKYTSTEPHLAYTFLQRHKLDVMSNELAKCIRLMKQSTNIVSFKVPRSKNGVFHSDLFPKSFVTWKEGITSDEWFQNSMKLPELHDFQPDGILKSEDVKIEIKAKKYDSHKELTAKKELSEQEIVSNLLDKMSSNMNRKYGTVQEEGVDEEEWND